MKFRGLVSVLCSATCGIGGVGARQNGGMKEKIAQMKKQSEEKINKILEKVNKDLENVTIEDLDRLQIEECEEIRKAQSVISLLNGEVSDFGDVLGILESLDKDPEAKKKALEFANVLNRNASIKRRMRTFLGFLFVTSGTVGFASLFIVFLNVIVKGFGHKLLGAFGSSVESEEEACRKVFIGGLVVAAISFAVQYLSLSGCCVCRVTSVECSGMEEALRKLVKEAEGMQNQVGASGNKLKEKKSGSSASNGGSQKSDKKGSRKSEGKKRSKVKGKEVGNSAKNEVLN